MADVSHTSILRILNGVYAVLAFASAIALLLAIVFLGATIAEIGGLKISTSADQTAANLPFFGLGFASVVLGGTVMYLAIIGALHLMVAARVGRGRGRTLQTVLAVLSIFNVPVGLAYGIYALWVCWFNDSTRALFERNTRAAASV